MQKDFKLQFCLPTQLIAVSLLLLPFEHFAQKLTVNASITNVGVCIETIEVSASIIDTSATADTLTILVFPESGTSVNIGSVSSSHGTIVSGNNSGDTQIRIQLDSLPSMDTVTVVYTIRIDSKNQTTVFSEITVSDTSGNSAIGQTSSISLLPISITASVEDESCYSYDDGSINTSVSGGNTPYTYLWSNGSSATNLSNLAAGTYSLTVNDLYLCETTVSYIVNQPDKIQINSTVSLYCGDFNVSDNGASDGLILITTTGGTEPLSYSWSNGTNIPTLRDVPAGLYTLSITDGNDCIQDTIFELTQPLPLTIPNGFSPDNNGINEKFEIINIEQYPENKFKVFNRYGGVVFSGNPYENDWYGASTKPTFGTGLPDGGYYYNLKRCPDDKLISGFIIIKRAE